MDEKAKAARAALEASRQIIPKAQSKSRSTSPTKKRKRESDNESEPLNQRLMVTLKFKGKTVQSFRQHGLSTASNDSSIAERFVGRITEKLALTLVHDAVDAAEGI